MSRRRIVFCGVVLLCVGFVGVLDAVQTEGSEQEAFVWAGQSLSEADYVPGELLVQFAPKAKGLERSKAEREAILTTNGGGTIERSYKIVPGLALVKLPSNVTVKDSLARLKNVDGIVYAEPNYKIRICATEPDDTYFGDLWGMHNTGQTWGTKDADIDAPEAWETATDASSIVVAVIDSGVDYGHPDLAANMWVNSGETPDDDIDNDENGYVDDIYGYDFVNDDGDPMDDLYHGTHCAGTIGA